MTHPARRHRIRRGLVALAGAGILAATLVGVSGSPGSAASRPTAERPASFSVTSFDGTIITGDFFVAPGASARHRTPTVLEGPGWGEPALDDPTEQTDPTVGIIGVAPLLAAGYNVVSWNPRGFSTSTGRAEADSSRYEGRDVSAIINWVAAQPWAELVKPGDPRVGMVGGSYGGEVQWAAAAVDHRIEAIVPAISWNALATSVDPDNTAKSGWDSLLYESALATGQRVDPHLDSLFTSAQASFLTSAANTRYLNAAGRHDLASEVRAPALILQGTIDTLFPLNQAAANYAELASHHVPVKMIWFCGGHGACLTNPGDTSVIQNATLAWLARYLKGQPVNTGPGFEWVDQQGTEHTAATYHANTTVGGVSGHGSGTLALRAAGGSGPYTGPLQLGPEAIAVATKATNAINVRIRFSRLSTVLGAPELSLTYRGTAPSPDARILAQIVDNATGLVLGSQLTPIPVTLNGKAHSVTLPLSYLAATATAASSFTLQLVADSSQFNTHASGGSMTFSSVHVSLPTAAPRCR